MLKRSYHGQLRIDTIFALCLVLNRAELYFMLLEEYLIKVIVI